MFDKKWHKNTNFCAGIYLYKVTKQVRFYLVFFKPIYQTFIQKKQNKETKNETTF